MLKNEINDGVLREEEKPDPILIKFSKFNYDGVLKISFNQKLKLLATGARRNLIDQNKLARDFFDLKVMRGDE